MSILHSKPASRSQLKTKQSVFMCTQVSSLRAHLTQRSIWRPT